jgi:hypothetical protein
MCGRRVGGGVAAAVGVVCGLFAWGLMVFAAYLRRRRHKSEKKRKASAKPITIALGIPLDGNIQSEGATASPNQATVRGECCCGHGC